MARIAVYAGHGGRDSGAVSGNLREKDFTLAISNAVTSILRGWGYTVINNRTTDTDRSITRDANLANENRVDAVIDIHLNSNEGTPGTGSEAFISIRDATNFGGRARTLANAILARLANLGFRNRGVFTSVNAAGADTFGILRLTQMPAVLLEVAFINNPQDMARLNVDTVANAIAEGVRQVFPLSGGGLPPYPGTAIRIGAQGESVRQIQRCLNRVALTNPSVGRLAEDGIFGPRTQASVIAFQRIANLTPDGIVGDAVIIRPTQKTQHLSGFRGFSLISCTSNNSMGLGVHGGCPPRKEDKHGQGFSSIGTKGWCRENNDGSKFRGFISTTGQAGFNCGR